MPSQFRHQGDGRRVGDAMQQVLRGGLGEGRLVIDVDAFLGHQVQLVQRILEALFALHPMVRWIARRIDLEREIACDDSCWR